LKRNACWLKAIDVGSGLRPYPSSTTSASSDNCVSHHLQNLLPLDKRKARPREKPAQLQEKQPNPYFPLSPPFLLLFLGTSSRTPNNKKLSTYFRGLTFSISFLSESSNGPIALYEVNGF
jgi:hypothetical protein